MSSGYYDYQPLIVLPRPVALTSLMAEETRRVALQLTALSGLGYHDLDRAIEHEAGMSIWQLIAEQGEAAYRSLEHQVLPQLLDDRPPGVLVLGDGALIDPGHRELVRERATLVTLELDLASWYWRLRQSLSQPSSRWHPLASAPLHEISDLRPFYQLRRAGYESAHHVVQLAGRRRTEVVEQIWGLVSRRNRANRR